MVTTRPGDAQDFCCMRGIPRDDLASQESGGGIVTGQWPTQRPQRTDFLRGRYSAAIRLPPFASFSGLT